MSPLFKCDRRSHGTTVILKDGYTIFRSKPRSIASLPKVDTFRTLAGLLWSSNIMNIFHDSVSNVHNVKVALQRKLFADKEESSLLYIQLVCYFFNHFVGYGVLEELMSNERGQPDLEVRLLPRKFQYFCNSEALPTQYGSYRSMCNNYLGIVKIYYFSNEALWGQNILSRTPMHAKLRVL